MARKALFVLDDGRLQSAAIAEADLPAAAQSVGEVLVADGVSPPVMLTNEEETDFLYEG